MRGVGERVGSVGQLRVGWLQAGWTAAATVDGRMDAMRERRGKEEAGPQLLKEAAVRGGEWILGDEGWMTDWWKVLDLCPTTDRVWSGGAACACAGSPARPAPPTRVPRRSRSPPLLSGLLLYVLGRCWLVCLGRRLWCYW